MGGTRQLGMLAALAVACLAARAWAWGLAKGEVQNPDLPKVLLIGDSIVGGYGRVVGRLLEGRATVDVYGNPYNQANNAWHGELKGILSSNGPYAVIHFNLGLHGWRKGDIPEGKFEALTGKCVETLRQGAPGASLIWGSTTPIVTTNRPYAPDPEANAAIIDHNARAARVMHDLGVPVNDLYGVLQPRLNLSQGDRFHWQGEAYVILALAVEKAIESRLPLHDRAREARRR